MAVEAKVNGAVPPAPTYGMMPISRDIAEAIADDAEMLAALHDRELTASFLEALRDAKFPQCLGLMPDTDEAMDAWQGMSLELETLARSASPRRMDELAAEYAAIYLTNAYGASPYESYWTDDDHLLCQDSMFQWRAIYKAAGLCATDWRQRPDDHLVLQLLYIAHAVRTAHTQDDWRELARKLDEHTLMWVSDFANRIATRSSAPFYPALALVTATWCETLRELLTLAVGIARPTPEEIAARTCRKANVDEQVLTFIPGGNAPSW